MFGFKAKPADVLSHWYSPVAGFTASTQDFYTAVESALKEQQVPGLEISRVEFSERGLLSGKRTYLRMTRERLVFDICAAPFGTNYFYSIRYAQLPVQVSLFAIILLFIAAIVLFSGAVRFFGFFLACFLGVPALVFGIYALRNLVSLGLSDLDATLLKLQMFGPVYERFFHKDTYYREDTKLMYQTVVEGIVKKLVEQETAGKGVKLLQEYEYAPILKDLYHPSVKRLDEKPETP
jgi:hypothetical protein